MRQLFTPARGRNCRNAQWHVVTRSEERERVEEEWKRGRERIRERMLEGIEERRRRAREEKDGEGTVAGKCSIPLPQPRFRFMLGHGRSFIHAWRIVRCCYFLSSQTAASTHSHARTSRENCGTRWV